MADGIKGTVGQIIEDVNEAAVKPFVDEVGKALEEGAQSFGVTPQTQDPAVLQRKQVDEQKKKAWNGYVRDQWNKQIEENTQKVRQENAQKLQQQDMGEKQEEKINQYEIVQKKKEDMVVRQAQTKTEKKGTIGG